jgi:hypothetical protein
MNILTINKAQFVIELGTSEDQLDMWIDIAFTRNQTEDLSDEYKNIMSEIITRVDMSALCVNIDYRDNKPYIYLVGNPNILQQVYDAKPSMFISECRPFMSKMHQ